MASIGSLIVNITSDISGLTKGLEDAQGKVAAVSKGMKSAGAGLTAGVTVPMVAMGAAAVASATQFNSSMANVQTLLTDLADGGTARTQELGEAVQAMAVTTGKSTGDLAGGLYQVISAFGDTADTVSILDINARAATAGLATTEEAIALTSAVTKAYGDTSAEAIQKSTDLAFMAVKLGQTDFPQLAASLGRVTGMSNSLGVSQEELFATFATATGVTGSAAEVSTQLAGIYAGLMAPTGELADLISSLGYESSTAMIAQEGLQGTIAKIVGAAEATGAPLQKYLGSIEAQRLAIQLAGAGSAKYAENLAEMGSASGATAAAFAAQTSGVNETGFAMQQMQQQMAVIAQDLGAALMPALAAMMPYVTSLANVIADLANRFATADAGTQKWILAIGAVAAAAGPVLMVLGTLVSSLSGLGAVFGVVAGAIGPVVSLLGVLLNPITLVVAAVGGLLAVLFNWGGANEKVAQTLQNWGLEGVAEWVRSLHEGVVNLTTAVGDFFSGETSFSEFFDAVVPDWITTLFSWAWPVLGPIAWIVKLTSWAWPTLSKPSWVQKLLDFKWPKFPSLPGWMGGNGGDAGNNAAGTPRWRGGLTWVGEEGPELVNLPRGTQIFPADMSAAMAGAGGQNVTVNINANVASDVDVNRLARRVVQEIKTLSI